MSDSFGQSEHVFCYHSNGYGHAGHAGYGYGVGHGYGHAYGHGYGVYPDQYNALRQKQVSFNFWHHHVRES